VISKLKPKSEFTKNVLTLMTGTTIAQAIPIAISPILTRLYTPEDFGVFALFVAITSIFGSIANGRYELAIMLPRRDEDAINIMALGFIINVTLSLFLLLIVIIFHDKIVSLLNNKEISPWLYLVPVSVFLMGLFNLLNYFNNRKKFYKDLAKAKIYKSIGMAIVQISFGFVKVGAFGLISGQIFSQIISNTKLFFNIKRLNLLKKIKKVKMIVFAKRYKKLPLYNLPNAFIDGFRLTMINVLIGKFFSLSMLGQFSLALRMVQTPSSLMGGAISQVFFQKISMSNKKEIKYIVKKFIFKAALVSLPLFIIIFLFGKNIFSLIFGEKWKVAGEIAQILTPWLFFNFLTAPLSTLFIKFNKQDILLIFAFFYTMLPIFLFFYMENYPLLIVMKYFSLLMSCLLIIFIGLVFFILKDE